MTAVPTLSGTTTTTTTLPPGRRPTATPGAYQPGKSGAGVGTAQVNDLRTSLVTGLAPGGFGLTADDLANAPVRTGYNSTTTVAQALNDLYGMAGPELQALQVRLYEAGLFTDQVYNGNGAGIRWGTADDATADAYRKLLNLGIIYPDRALTQILDEQTLGFSQSDRGGGQQRRAVVAGGNTYTINLDDPAELRTLAEQIGQKVLGRKPDKGWTDKAVAGLIGDERAAQQRDIAAKEGSARGQFDATVGAANAQDQANAGGAVGGVAPVGGGDGKALSADAIARVAYNAGFRGNALVTSVAVAMAESGGRAGAHNPNASTGDDSWGLWQVNYYADLRDERIAQYGQPEGQTDPQHNANSAFAISGGGRNFKPWTTFTSGTYKKHLSSAAAAAARVEAQGGVTPEAQAARNRMEQINTEPGDAERAATQTGVDEARAAGLVPQPGVPAPSATGPASPDTYLPPTTVEVTNINPQARLAEQLRAQHPDEAGAHDYADIYARMLNFLGITGA